jgi:hypothetical protein
MPIVVWIVIGAGGLMGTSILVGLAIAMVLGQIGEEVSELLDAGECTEASMTEVVDEPVFLHRVENPPSPFRRASVLR